MVVQIKDGVLHVTHDGRTQTLKAWCREMGVSDATARYRMGKGWDFEDVFSKTKGDRGRPSFASEYVKRGCYYCADYIDRECIHEKCPYHELDNVKSYNEYLKKAKKGGLVKILESI